MVSVIDDDQYSGAGSFRGVGRGTVGCSPPEREEREIERRRGEEDRRKEKRGTKKRKEVEPVIPRTYVVMGL